MEGDEEGGDKQMYDTIDDSDEETSKSSSLTTPVRGKTAESFAARKNKTETSLDKRSILQKVREKFQRKSTVDSGSDFFVQSSGQSNTSARRRVLRDMKNKAMTFDETFLSWSNTKSSVESRSRSKTLKFGTSSPYKHEGSKNENMLMLEHNYEHIDNSCGAPQLSKLSKKQKASCTGLSQDSTLCTKDDSDIPAVPDRPWPQPSNQNQRRRAKSLDQAFLNKDRIRIENLGNALPQDAYEDRKCNPASKQRSIQGNPSSLSTNLENLSHCGWYWGPLRRAEAIRKLEGKPDGSFLVRDSFHESHLYSVTFRTKGRTLHTRITYDGGRFGFAGSSGLFPSSNSVVSLVDRAMKISLKGPWYASPSAFRWPSYPIQFSFPVSRYEDFPSLKHLCRFVIRQSFSFDKLHELPLPPKLRRYLNVNNAYLPEAEVEFV